MLTKTKIKDILLLGILSIFVVVTWLYGFFQLEMRWEFASSLIFFVFMFTIVRGDVIRDIAEDIGPFFALLLFLPLLFLGLIQLIISPLLFIAQVIGKVIWFPVGFLFFLLFVRAPVKKFSYSLSRQQERPSINSFIFPSLIFAPFITLFVN